MTLAGFTRSVGPPDPDKCRSDVDVGTLHHDERDDTWYECVRDERHRVVTWAIVPPGD